MTKQNIFNSRMNILLFVLASGKPVSNIDVQCRCSELTKCALNRLLSQFVEWGYLERVKCGNKYLYLASEKTKQIFGEIDEKRSRD